MYACMYVHMPIFAYTYLWCHKCLRKFSKRNDEEEEPAMQQKTE